MKHFFIILLAFLCSTSMAAQKFEYTANPDHTVTVRSILQNYSIDPNNIYQFGCIIPDEISYGKVTIVRFNGFTGIKTIKTVVLGKNIITIEDKAFYDCVNLSNLDFGDSSSLVTIGDLAFSNTDLSGLYDFPDGLVTIGNKAFQHAFTNGQSYITLPNSVNIIGNWAFEDCEGLSSVKIGDGVTTIGDYAFQYDSHLTGLTIGKSVKEIGKYAFYQCNLGGKISLPDTLTDLGEGAFDDCKGLTEVIIPNSLAVITNGAFMGCSGLKKLTIGNSVSLIGAYAFSSTSLTEIKCLATTPPTVFENSFSGFAKNKCKLKVPLESVSKYEYAPIWKDFDIVGINGIEGVEADKLETEITEIYNLQGQRMESLQNGINIVRRSDGTSRKIFVK